jgi:hypothetical protein
MLLQITTTTTVTVLGCSTTGLLAGTGRSITAVLSTDPVVQCYYIMPEPVLVEVHAPWCTARMLLLLFANNLIVLLLLVVIL